MRIVFIGCPGAGKGTQAANLSEHLSVPHLSTGEMLREAVSDKTELGERAVGFISRGRLVPDELIVQVVSARLEEEDCSRGFLLDGFPRTIAQAESLDAFLASRRIPLQMVLMLEVPRDELERRLLERGRGDDTPEAIDQRFDSYKSQTEPLLDYYRKTGLLREIDAAGPVKEIFERIKLVVDTPEAVG
jgi:adenylate kinase